MNKIYRVIWSTVLQVWVVVSELTNKKQKTANHSSCTSTHQDQSNKQFKISTVALTLFSSLAIYNNAYAISVDDCNNSGGSCVTVGTAAALATALGSTSTATTILLTNNINLSTAYTAGIAVNQATQARQNLVIDGGGFNLNYAGYAFTMTAAGTNNAAWAGQNATFELTNFGDITSTSAITSGTVSRLIYAQDATTRLTATIDNINSVPNGKLFAMGIDGASAAANSVGRVVFGSIIQPITLNFGTYRQSVLGSNITFNGNFNLTGITSPDYPAVFWSNDTAANSVLHFAAGSNVNITGTRLTNGPSVVGVGVATYNYLIDDGAALTLTIDSQNPLGVANYGVQIGSYDTVSGLFGSGAVINMNNLAGDVISNAPSTTTTSYIYNGPVSANNVVYNLAPGSNLVVAANAANDGIIATKTTGIGGIYIRSAATISDGTADTSAGTGINVTAGSSGDVVILNDIGGNINKATGITVTDSGSSSVNVTNAGTINSTTAGVAIAHNGSGTATLTNSGSITSTTAGLALSSTTSGKAISVNSTGGTINATGGSGITLGNNVALDLLNGTIATTGLATGLTIGATNAGVQTLNGTIFNLEGSGSAISKDASGTVNLTNTQFNATSGTVFNTLTGLNFLQGTANNTINLTGTGVVTGIRSVSTALDLSSAYLDINVNNSAATGISTSGATGASVTIGPNTTINASGGAAAITFGNTIAESLINTGVISGSISMGNSGNTINNNGTLGSLTSGLGADTLTLGSDSISAGIIDLGAGNNTINIDDGATIYAINTGDGNDAFNINNLTSGSTTSLGVLNAGDGTNTLSFSNSTRALLSGTSLQNFTDINLNNNSNIILTDANNITSGNVNVTAGNTLLFGNTYNGTFNAVLNGAGTVEVQSAGNLTLNTANTFSGNWLIDTESTLNANQISQLGSASVALNGVLNFANSGTFENVLTGNGRINVKDNNGAFYFGAGAGTEFAGTVDINNATFNLSALNASALGNATLSGSAGSVITFDTGTNNVGNLTFNGGTLQFSPGGIISTGLLSITNDSVIQADPALLTTGNMLDLNAGVYTELVTSSNTLSAGDLARLQLQDLSGNSLSGGTTVNYLQNSQVVAVNTYNFNLVSNLGLSIYEELTQSNLQAGQTLSLTSNGASNTTLTTQLTGTGNLAIDTDNVALTLSNDLNDYSGSTTVNAGSLTLGTSDALGNTSLLDVRSGATVNLAGNTQTVGTLSNTGTIGLAGGVLNVTNGGTSSTTGGLTGAGVLNINGGTFTVTGANSGLSAQTTVASDAIATLSGAGDLGSGGIEIDGTLNLNGANAAFANSLSGAGTVNANAAIELTGSSTFSGTFDVNTNASLTANSAANLGNAAIDLTDATAQLLLNGFTGILANTLSGVANSTIQLNNASATTLTGTNSSFAGLFELTGNSALTVSQTANLGIGSVNIGNGSTFIFDTFAGGALTTLNNALSGTGNWVLHSSNLDLSDNSNAASFSGLLNINTDASLTLNSTTALDTATVLNVNDATSTLNITNSGAFILNNALTGAGQVNVDTANGAFNFGTGAGNGFNFRTDAGNAFTGNVTLNNATFLLADTNASALAGAGLTLATGSNTTVGGTGTQTLQTLVLNGGTLNFTGGAPLSSAESTINAQTLTANSGTINVVTGGSWNNDLPVVAPNLSILDQNRGATAMELINAATAIGANNLTLTIDGDPVTEDGLVSTINQNTFHVADATYNYSLSNTNGVGNSGLYLNYGLSAINLRLDNANALVIATDASPTSNKVLTAQLTGDGGIVFNATQGELTVTNDQNNYIGTTTVTGGNVLLGSNNAFGATSLLTVANGASFNTNNFSQTVGALTNLGTITIDPAVLTSTGPLTNTGVIDIAGGTLNLEAGGTSTNAGGLTGAGTLNVDGGDLALSAANSGLSAITNIASGASVTLSAADALGTSAVNVGGTLNLDAADTLVNILSGAGIINTDAAVTLSGNNSFSGTHNINSGGALTITAANNLGTSVASVDLNDATAQLLLNGFTDSIANSLSGVADSTVQLNNTSATTLTGDNSDFAGVFNLTGNSALTVSQNANLGTGSVSIGSGSTLNFDAFAVGALTTLNNVINGAGNWVLRNSNIDLSGSSNAANFSGLLNINTDASLTLNSTTALDADTVLNVNDATSTLNITNSGAFTLSNALTGAGQVNVDTANGAFNFGTGAGNGFNFRTDAGNAFTGNVTLNNATFLLADTNASALAGAGLTLATGSNTTVGGTGSQTLQTLTLNGGTLNFTGGAPLSSAESTINAQTLTATSGTINVVTGGSWNNDLPVIAPNLSILDQNRGTTAMELINAATAIGANNLTLSIDGVAVTSSQDVVSAINQNTFHVADATYNYSLANTNGVGDSGLYVNYGLSAINLLLDNANALVIATDTSAASNKDLTARLSGVGGIVFDATNGALTVTNSQNNYTGTTTVTGGNVLLGSNNAFGNTSLLTVNSGASFNTNSFDQTVGALTNQGTVTLNPGVMTSGLLTNTGVIDLTGGTLNLSAGGTSTATNGLTGAGTLNVNAGTLTLSAANSGLSGSTQIASGAAVTLTEADALGTSTVAVGGTLSLDAADSLANILSGTGMINTNAALALSGNNTFSGTHNINACGVLTVSAANNLGISAASVDLTNATSQLVFSALNGDVANTLTGVANSTITVDNGANMSLSAINSGFMGQFGISGNSILSVSQNQNLGSASVNIDNGSQLVFANLTGTLNNTISGNGIWALSNSDVTLNNANAATFIGTVSINGGSVLNVDSANLLNTAATVNIVTANDTLNISNNGDFIFDNPLLGTGVLNINTNNNLFSFGNNVGSGFTGRVNLQNTQFQLSDDNTSSNSNTVLNLETNSRTSVGDGIQNIGSLVMTGGTLTFDNIINNNGILSSAGTIAASDINTTGGGTVSVALPPTVSPSLEGLSLLSLDTGAIVVELARGAATGTGRELTLTDGTNVPITEDFFQGVTNPSSSVVSAMGTFGFGLTTGVQRDGLYVNYGLKSIDLLTADSDALTLVGTAAFNGSSSNDFIAQITGSGDLAISEVDAGAIVTLSAANNTYTGATLVRSGTLQLNADSALGNTSNLEISSGATVDINGHTQTVGALNGATSSTLNLDGGNLTVSNGGAAAGTLTGAGNLVLNGGTLAISNNNDAFSGTTTINNGATADITQARGLGTGSITVDGTLQLDGTAGGLDTATLTNTLLGSGNTLLSNAANVTLGGNNSSYSGTFTTLAGTTLTATNSDNLGSASVLNAGSLVLNTSGYWDLATPISGSGSLVKQGSGTVHIGNSLVSAGMTTVQSGTLLVGSAPANAPAPLVFSLMAASAIVSPQAITLMAASAQIPTLLSNVTVQANGTFGGDGQVSGDVSNAGNIVIGHAATGSNYSNFIINGNYVGNGGNITLDTVLSGDNAATDKLVVTGNTSGNSTITVNNIGGEGAKNTKGIQVISVGGTSEGTFTLNGRAQAGVLEYFLYQGTLTEPADGSWYLGSNYQDNIITYNPEAGGFIANIAAANTLFNTRLEDLHTGDAQNAGELTGADTHSSLWLRQVGSRNKFRDASGQLSNSSNRYVVQLGGEVFDTQFTGQDRFGLGVMAGYGRSTGTTDSAETSYKADNSLTGYTLGVYGTWYARAAERHSPYIHGWLQYEWFNATVSSSAYDSGSYHLRGVSTSLEGGYPVEIYHGEQNQTYITPQAQLTLNGAKMSDLQNNGSVVRQDGNNNLQTRLGAKLSNDTLMGKDKSRILTTYLDLNWLQNTRLPGVSSDGLGVQQTGSRHLVEVKIGAEGKLSNNFSVWGNLTQQFGQQGYDDKAAMLGVKYTF